MNRAAVSEERIAISAQTVRDVQATSMPADARLVLKRADGSEQHLPANIQKMLMRALASVAERGTVTIGEIPEVLTSTSAAELLDVSRPTLMKWARDGEIDSFKVGTHARFRREDVLVKKAARVAERQAAFEELRALDARNMEHFAD